MNYLHIIDLLNYLIPIASIMLIVLLFFLKNSFHLLVSETTDEIRKIHAQPVIKIGGISLLSVFFYLIAYKESIFFELLFFSLIFFSLGLIADFKEDFSSKIRFIAMIIVLIFFTIDQNLLIDDLDHQFLNQIFLFSYISSFIFVILSMMFIINGLNFIDGNNGLMLGVTLIILLNFALYTEASNHEIHLFVICLSLSIIALFLVNFFTGKIICGDGGAYFLGFLIGVISILISENDIVFATQVACIIFYPVFELFFTFWRRIFFEKISPFEPDDLHLHSLIYRILKLKMKSKFNANILNSTTAVLILIMLTFFSIILFYYGQQIGYLNFFFMQSFIYLIIYLHLYSYLKKI